MNEPKLQNGDVHIGHLIVNIARLLASRGDRSMEQFGLYWGQAIFLKMLSCHDGLTHSEMAEKLEISPAAATKVIKRLEEMNYLQRQADPADERISRIFLRDEGRAVVHRMGDIFKHNDQLLRSDLTPEEQATLTSLLVRVHSALQKSSIN